MGKPILAVSLLGFNWFWECCCTYITGLLSEKGLLSEHWYKTRSPYSVRALSKVSRQGGWQSNAYQGVERGNHMVHFSLSSVASSNLHL